MMIGDGSRWLTTTTTLPIPPLDLHHLPRIPTALDLDESDPIIDEGTAEEQFDDSTA